MKRGLVIGIIVIVVLLVLGVSTYKYTGAIIGIDDCYDSDGGKNLEVRGTARNTAGLNGTDYCSSTGQAGMLEEYYCDMFDRVKSKNYHCDCFKGACVD